VYFQQIVRNATNRIDQPSRSAYSYVQLHEFLWRVLESGNATTKLAHARISWRGENAGKNVLSNGTGGAKKDGNRIRKASVQDGGLSYSEFKLWKADCW